MEYIIISLLILVNGFFALSEIAIISSGRARLEAKKKKGIRGAIIALKLLKKPEQFLSAIQIGITLIGIIAGAYGGVTLSEKLEPYILKNNLLAPYAYQLSIIIVVGIITYFSVVVGELLPKTLAISNPEKIAIGVAPVIFIFSKIVFPLVVFLSFSTKLIQKILFIKSSVSPSFTEDELRAMIRLANTQGVIEKKESEYHENLFRFADRQADQIMTHRGQIVGIELNSSKDKIEKIIRESGFSKYPVYQKTTDNLFGILYARDFFENYENPGFKLADLVNEPLYLQESMSALKILELFRKNKNYVGIVVDEYGTFAGMITLHDLIENIVGELPDADEKEDLSVIRREDGSFLIDGLFKIDELENVLSEFHDTNKDKDYTTIAGFVIFHLEKIPKAGDHFHFQGYRFEVMDMDGQRVDKILVSRENL